VNTATRPVSPLQVRQMLGTSIWALHITWATSALLTLGLGGTVVLRGLLPAALAWTSRGLINAAVRPRTVVPAPSGCCCTGSCWDSSSP
jgi:hypothetical protein